MKELQASNEKRLEQIHLNGLLVPGVKQTVIILDGEFAVHRQKQRHIAIARQLDDKFHPFAIDGGRCQAAKNIGDPPCPVL